MSAGRLYDKIGKKAKAKVFYVLHNVAICKIVEDKKKNDDVEIEVGKEEE